MRIGVVSDTHDYFDPRLPEFLSGVDHILHAGDIGQPKIILELEKIAPVTAVLGNTDYNPTYRDTEVLRLQDQTFLIHHIVEPKHLYAALAARIQEAKPNVIVFGHTHQRFQQTVGGRLFLNPGYAGTPRGNQPRSIALITISGEVREIEFRDLDA